MRGQGIPTGYAYRVKRATTMERCCMGVVCQIKDLDNSSSAVPYKTHIPSPDAVHDPTPYRGSTKALPYKSTVTSIVGEGCSPLGRRHEVTVGEASPPRNAPPETSVKMTL